LTQCEITWLNELKLHAEMSYTIYIAGSCKFKAVKQRAKQQMENL